MTEKIIRNYLEIKSIKELLEVNKPSNDYILKKISKNDFQLNKFFYKQIGKNYHWFDRLVWSDREWINYVSNPDVFSYVLMQKKDLAGFFEFIYHPNKSEIEIAYFGVLKEYMKKKLGGYMLSEAIKKSFTFKIKRVWVHTCSLDHKNALLNYKSKGFEVFKEEEVNYVA